MKILAEFLEKTFKFLASLKLAIIVMSALGIMSAVGTIVEARYDAEYAQKMIYHSPLMYFIMALLCVNLLNVMIDRLPWKAHHMGFIFAHIGIIVLIVGSLVSRLYGVDGSMSFGIGETRRYVTVPETEIVVFASLGEANYRPMYSGKVDFLLRPPHKEKYEIQVGSDKILIKDFYPFAMRESKIVESGDAQDQLAIRIQIQNPVANMNMSQWLHKTTPLAYEPFDFGPAKFSIADPKYKHVYESGNEIIFRQSSKDVLEYEVYTARQGGFVKKGKAQIGDVIDPGWMGMSIRVLNYYSHAREKIEYIKKDRPTPLTIPAIQVEFQGNEHWLGLNSNLKLFTDMAMYLVSYRNRAIDIGFDLKLDKFTVGRYQGTNRAMSYESDVTVPGVGSQKISMNNPLKHNGFTFYQASFQEDERGQPVASILSVNKDPGRPWKYFGSALIVLGTIIMFYFKRYRSKIFSTLVGDKKGQAT